MHKAVTTMVRIALMAEENAASEYLALAPRLRGASLRAITGIQELDSDSFDAVVVGARDAGEQWCRFAAAHGKHILLATPLTSSAEATTLMQVCQTRGVRLMAGSLDRFRPSVHTIKQSLDLGQLGVPGLIRIHRWQSQAGCAPNMVNDVDLALWMFQSLPTEVYAVARRGVDDAVTYVQIHLGFPGGGMGLIDLSSAHASADGYFSLSLIGSTGAAYADDHHNQQLLFQGDHPIALKSGDGNAARLAQLQEFVDWISGQREPVVSGADARAAVLVCEAAGQSIESGQAARLSGDRYEC